MNVEIIGIIASMLVMFAFAQKDAIAIRTYDLAGAVLYVLYGFMIHSLSNILLNCVLVCIQIYHLYHLLKKE